MACLYAVYDCICTYIEYVWMYYLGVYLFLQVQVPLSLATIRHRHFVVFGWGKQRERERESVSVGLPTSQFANNAFSLTIKR